VVCCYQNAIQIPLKLRVQSPITVHDV